MVRRPVVLLSALLAVLGSLAMREASSLDAGGFGPINVTKTADSNDGTCSAGDCSLREAVIEANTRSTSPAAPQLINVPAGTYILTIGGPGENLGATGDLDIRNSVILRGAGRAATVIDGNAADRVLDVFYPNDLVEPILVHLEGLTVRNAGPDTSITAVGVHVHGDADLIVSNVAIRDNDFSGLRASPDGGISPHSDRLVISDSIIDGNRGRGIDVLCNEITISATTISDNAGGIRFDNLDCPEPYGVVIRDSVISGNVLTGDDTRGGGIESIGTQDFPVFDRVPSLRLTRTTVADNEAQYGGGLFHSTGEVLIEQSTFFSNGAVNGGAIYVAHSESGIFFVSIENSTLSGNGTVFGNGGGIYLRAGRVNINNSTVAANFLGFGGFGGGLYARAGTTVSGSGTIIAANTGGDCGGQDPASGGHNLDSDSSCFFAASDVHADPLLGPLANNGGPTRTHRLKSGSPALDAGAASCAAADQRSIARPQGGVCDIGAFEARQCLGRPESKAGTNAGETITGSAGPDVILALGGDDTVNGGGGVDYLCGGTGDDTLNGQEANDRLNGGAQHDVCDGGPGLSDTAVNCEEMPNIP
ncbi:MAG: choice-of-anchor Q domain-containing protein [Dehalococcoidia bacterium]